MADDDWTLGEMNTSGSVPGDENRHVIHCAITGAIVPFGNGFWSLRVGWAGHVWLRGFQHGSVAGGKPFSLGESTYSNN